MTALQNGHDDSCERTSFAPSQDANRRRPIRPQLPVMLQLIWTSALSKTRCWLAPLKSHCPSRSDLSCQFRCLARKATHCSCLSNYPYRLQCRGSNQQGCILPISTRIWQVISPSKMGDSHRRIRETRGPIYRCDWFQPSGVTSQTWIRRVSVWNAQNSCKSVNIHKIGVPVAVRAQEPMVESHAQ
jgi:hypothetical protein